MSGYSIQWYPGHMTKAKRMMQENIRLVDLVIEILDARVPQSSRNPDIDQLAQGKERLLILGKQDLADPAETQLFLEECQRKNLPAIAMDLRTKNAKGKVLRAIQDATKAKRERDLRRGIKNRPVRAMICGIPNVGKSTFINTISGRASAKTGNKPGVTTGKQWISFQGIDLLDTPGILWPKFDDPDVGIRLALVGSIRDEVLDEEELARRLLGFLLRWYPGVLADRYVQGTPTAHMSLYAEKFLSAEDREMSYNRTRLRNSGETGQNPEESRRSEKDGQEAGREREREHLLGDILEDIASARNQLRAGGEPDPKKAAHLVLDDFRAGRLGAITLDRMEVQPGGSRESGAMS